jgi:hypothetical protein
MGCREMEEGGGMREANSLRLSSSSSQWTYMRWAARRLWVMRWGGGTGKTVGW